MIKILKRWGSGLGIYFDNEEIDLYGLKEGDKLDLSDFFLIDSVKLKKLPKSKNIQEDIKKEVKK